MFMIVSASARLQIRTFRRSRQESLRQGESATRRIESDRMSVGVDQHFAAADVIGLADQAVLLHPLDQPGPPLLPHPALPPPLRAPSPLPSPPAPHPPA